MRFVFLGTGPTKPVLGKGKDRRLNSSAYIQNSANILIDVTPFFDVQSKLIDKIDAVLLSHGHTDAINGWYKLRKWLKERNIEKIPVYCERETKERILDDFKDTSFAEFRFFKPGDKIKIGNLTIIPFRVKHFEAFPSNGKRFPTVGFRINDIVYAEDMEAIPKESERYFKDASVIIADGAMWFGKQIRGHMNTEQALEIAKKYKPKILIITQAGRTYPPYNEAIKTIQKHAKIMGITSKVQLAYDGMVINLSSLERLKKGEEGETRSDIAHKFWTENWYKVFPKSGKGKFVYQHHWRGLTEEEKNWSEDKLFETNRSVHGDLRLQFSPNSLFGFTIFLGTTDEAKKRDLDNLKPNDKLQGTWKLIQPKAWLTFEGVTKPGEIGATAKKYAKFFIKDKGTYEIGVWRQHFIELFLHGKKLKGRYIIVYAPIRPGGKRVWLIGKPKDQTPYAARHYKGEVIKELKEKGQKYLIWAQPGCKPILYDVTKVKFPIKERLSAKRFTFSVHQLGPEKHFDLYLEKDGYADCWAFKPMKVGEKNVLKLGSRVKRQLKQPLAWLSFEGTIPRGKPGASRNYPGIVRILDKGDYETLFESRGYFKYKFNGRKLNGIFVIHRITDEDEIRSTKYQYVFDKPNEFNDSTDTYSELLAYIEALTRETERNEENLYSEGIKITSELSEKLIPLKIRGVALREGTWNGLFYPREELRKAAADLQGKPLMIDHSDSVRDLVGRVTKTWYNEAINGIEFEAEILDEEIARKVIEGLISGVSVGVIVDRVKEGNNLIARNYEFKELSLVLVPACTDCHIKEVDTSEISESF